MNTTTMFALFAFGSGSTSEPQYAFASSDETPLPVGVWPTRVSSMATGQDLVAPSSVERLVSSVIETQQHLAFLPIDEEKERLVEQYIREHAPARKRRKVLRRRKR